MKKIFVACIVLLLLLIVAAAGFGLYYPDHVITRLLTTSRWEPARAPPLEPATADTPGPGQANDDWLFDPSPTHHEP
jgi:hypothetical protein